MLACAPKWEWVETKPPADMEPAAILNLDLHLHSFVNNKSLQFTGVTKSLCYRSPNQLRSLETGRCAGEMTQLLKYLLGKQDLSPTPNTHVKIK